jgi:HPt (histidine-containing phosphotransfer) domain-containing protein
MCVCVAQDPLQQAHDPLSSQSAMPPATLQPPTALTTSVGTAIPLATTHISTLPHALHSSAAASLAPSLSLPTHHDTTDNHTRPFTQSAASLQDALAERVHMYTQTAADSRNMWTQTEGSVVSEEEMNALRQANNTLQVCMSCYYELYSDLFSE